MELTSNDCIRLEAEPLRAHSSTAARWNGPNARTPRDVIRLRGSVSIEHTLAKLGAERLWSLLSSSTTCRRSGP